MNNIYIVSIKKAYAYTRIDLQADFTFTPLRTVLNQTKKTDLFKGKSKREIFCPHNLHGIGLK